MRPFFFIMLAAGFLVMGGIFYAWYHEIIIIKYPVCFVREQKSDGKIVQKKIIKLTYYHRNKWHTEEKEVLWPDSLGEVVTYIIRNWLMLLDEEQVVSKQIGLEVALLSPSHTTIYLSFDRNPLQKQNSTMENLLFIEGLLKTLRQNTIPVQYVYFLVHHQPLSDNNLDFSQPWPIAGFLGI